MTVDASDRSSFLEVSDLIISAISRLDTKPILMGESMGGLFASYVAFRRPNKISKLILINPATSYERSGWPVLGQIIANTPKQIFPLVGISTLLLTAVEIDQFTRIGQSIVSQINSTETAIQVFNNLLDSANSVTTSLAPDTLNWRLTKWLGKGNFYLDNNFDKISTPSIVLVGKNDRLLPSMEEGRRLKKLMKNSKVELIELEGKGHAILDGSYDLADLLLTSKTFLRDSDSSEVYCPPPNAIDIKNADKQAGNLIKAVSPVFLSRRKDGVIVRGIDDIPTGRTTGRPVLLIGNHQLYGADLAIIIKEFLDSKNELVRGLAHPVLFSDTDSARSGGMGDPNMREMFQTFGAVKVSPAAIFELLQRNETVLLFPGGVKEAYHLKGEQYKLLWPEKTDGFVRMAGMFDALIVPFAAIGIADSVDIVLDANDIINLPFFGERAMALNENIPQARAGGNESFIAPISIPKAPSRNYFLFEHPIDTRELNIYDKKQSKEIYHKVKNSIENGISTLIKIRDSDPYKDFLPRALIETITQKQAPIPPLNRF
jgi:pimeloyl-ACP methyl ester carboxylesterase